MPGTIRGANSQWKDVAQIKKHLYERVAREVSETVEATRLRPSFGPAWRQLGVAQSRHGALDAAVGSVRRAVAVEPNDAQAHSVLGGIYRRKARSHYDGTGQYDMVTLRQAAGVLVARTLRLPGNRADCYGPRER